LKKTVALFLVLLIFLFSLISCSSGANDKKDENINLVRAYILLNNNFESLLQSREAKKNNKITRFDWNIFSASVKNGSKRVAEALEGNNTEVAKILRRVAQDIMTLVDEYNDEINSGEKPDDELLVQRISQGLEEAKTILKKAQ